MLTPRQIGTLRNRLSKPYQALIRLIKLLNAILKVADNVPAQTESYSPNMIISILINIDSWADDLSALLRPPGPDHPQVVPEISCIPLISRRSE
jgi:hypothetical protein